MSDRVLDALLSLRSFLFEAVYENTTATAEFNEGLRTSSRACGRSAVASAEFLDLRTIHSEGSRWPTATFIAGMTDRYASCSSSSSFPSRGPSTTRRRMLWRVFRPAASLVGL